jgi:hypothetical protein
MIFRIIDSIHNKDSAAEKRKNALTGKCKSPKVVRSEISGAFIVVLCESKSRDEANKARKYFRKNGIPAELQVVK